MSLRALTLWQPWAHAICYQGKDIENRSWAPPAWLLGHDVAIHAGKRYELPTVWAWPVDEVPTKAKVVFGAVVAVVRVVGIYLTYASSPWFAGPVGWELGDLRVLKEPVACRGFQGLWKLPDGVEQAVRGQL